ncbi:MAG: hypothetical protein AAFW69_00820 [Pseudomonadota bacterium]
MGRTALEKFERLEAIGHWRERPSAPPVEVVVKLGQSTLTLTTLEEAPLTHWSLAALTELGREGRARVFAPGADAEERLALADHDMLMALDLIAGDAERARKGGRSGLWFALFLALALLASMLLAPTWWGLQIARNLSDATLGRVAAEVRAEAVAEGAVIYCRATPDPRLEAMLRRVDPALAERVTVRLVRDPGDTAAIGPDGYLLLGQDLVRRATSPEELAGFIIFADAVRELRRTRRVGIGVSVPPLDLLRMAVGLQPGEESRRRLRRHWVEALPRELATRAAFPPFYATLTEAGLPHAPARAFLEGLSIRPPRGQARAPDPIGDGPFRPALPDQDWVALQGACDG